MIKGRKWIAALAVILSLSACGGGDGDISDVASGNNAAPAAENELGARNGAGHSVGTCGSTIGTNCSNQVSVGIR